MSEPYKVPFTYVGPPTRQIATAPDGAALRIVSCDGPTILIEDGVHVGDFETMAAARAEAQTRFETRTFERAKTSKALSVNPNARYLPIQWTTVP